MGPFFKDYQRSVRIPKAWSDGDGWLINYVGHPVQLPRRIPDSSTDF
jgi:hypothetical protein